MATEKENYAHNEIGTGQSHANMSVGRYIATRIPTLKPPMAKVPNPIRLLRLLNFQQWMFFLVAFLAWTWDAFDFFTVSHRTNWVNATLADEDHGGSLEPH